MTAEFTVIIERHAKNGVIARIAEIAGIAVTAATPAEARSKLAVQLKKHLSRERGKALRRKKPAAIVETMRVNGLPSTHSAARPARPTTNAHGSVRDSLASSPVDLDLLAKLLAEGRIEEMGKALGPSFDESACLPIPVKGKPLSEEIIEGRR